MCGRYSLFDTDRLYDRFNLSVDDYVPLSDQYNVTPGELMPVITNNGVNHLRVMRWGLIPHWVKSTHPAHLIINARADTLAEKPIFRPSLLAKRCLVPVSGYFEWKNTSRYKQPYYFHYPNHRLFAFAGLYNTHLTSTKPLYSYTIITTHAPRRLSHIHPRIPVILSRIQEQLWLDPGLTDPHLLINLLTSASMSKIKVHPVSPLVNSPANDTTKIIQPISLSASSQPPVATSLSPQ